MPQWIRLQHQGGSAEEIVTLRVQRVEHDRKMETPKIEYLGDDLEENIEDLDFEQYFCGLWSPTATMNHGKCLVNAGSYRLTGHTLGKGNFARVEEAVHSVLKVKVALKIMNMAEIHEDYVIKNLHREAKIMSRLNHPCIAMLYEALQCDTCYCIVSELAAGGDLCNHIKMQRLGKLEERLAKTFARQMVSALAYMHERGIVHRDLKMENIMLNQGRTQVKIVDFGLSNTWQAGRMLSTHCGSPEYAAPELFITGQHYGPEIDIWSIGVIFYGMVMGQLPFLTSRDPRVNSQERRKQLLHQINRGLSATHRKALSSMSVEFRAMVARLLVPDPGKRIKMPELVANTWLTDLNKRPLRVTGRPKLEGSFKTFILEKMSNLLSTKVSEIQCKLMSDPYGNMGGFYNILAQKQAEENRSARLKDVASNSKPQIVEDVQIETPTVTQMKIHEYWKADTDNTTNRIRVVGSRGAENSYNIRAAQKDPAKLEVSSGKTGSYRRPSSEPLAGAPRAFFTGPTHTAERALKRKTCHSAANTSKVTSSARSNTSSTKSRLSESFVRKPKAPEIVESRTITRAFSNPDNKNPPCKPDMSKKLSNQPIARSIAGYVANNIHAHLNKQYNWIKGFAALHDANRTTAEQTYKPLAVRR